MRLSGFSLLGLLAALAIVALLMAHAFSHQVSGAGSTGQTGGFSHAISSAQQSVAQQDAAATTASRLTAP